MQKLVIIFFLLNSCLLSAQSLTGEWEGVVKLNNRGSRTMNFRLELLEGDKKIYGVFYTRGTEKGTVFGCDFIVSGQLVMNYFWLKPVHLQRAVAISKEECGYLDNLTFFLSKNDTTVLKGTWIWVSGATSDFTCKKVSNDVSLTARDELEDYKKRLYTAYEEQKVLLAPAERLNVPVKVITVDSTTTTVDVFSADKDPADTVDIYINDELIIEQAPLSVKPVRLVLQSLDPGENELILINRSKVKSSVKLLVRISSKQDDLNFETVPTFTKNMVILFKRE
jgi:hypothetical protein